MEWDNPRSRPRMLMPGEFTYAWFGEAVIGGWGVADIQEAAIDCGLRAPPKSKILRNREVYVAELSALEQPMLSRLQANWDRWKSEIADGNPSLYPPNYLQQFPQIIWSPIKGSILMVRRTASPIISLVK